MSGGHAARATRVQPTPAGTPDRGGQHLKIVRPQRRRSPAVPVLVGVGIILVALFATAAMHALMIGRQVQLDDMNRTLASEMEEVERLRLRVAELEAPDRVLDAARTRLGMVEPTDVGYVLPVEVASVSEESVRVTPATAPTTTVAPVREEEPIHEDGPVQQDVPVHEESAESPPTSAAPEEGAESVDR